MPGIGLRLEWRKFADGSKIAVEINAYVNQSDLLAEKVDFWYASCSITLSALYILTYICYGDEIRLGSQQGCPQPRRRKRVSRYSSTRTSSNISKSEPPRRTRCHIRHKSTTRCAQL